MTTITVHNGKHQSTTLKALSEAAKGATGKAKSTIQDLIRGLKTNPTAARGRRSHKEASAMAKKHSGGHKKATHKKKTNPTTHHKRSTKRRVNPSTSGGAFKGVDFAGIAIRGAATAAGGLGQSLVARQVEKFLPSLPRVASQALATGLVAGAALFIGKGKGLAEDAAVGAIATGISGMAAEFLPGVFAGTEEEAYVAGYEDGMGALQYVDEDGQPVGSLSFEDEGVAGLSSDGSYIATSIRPDNL